MLIKSLEFFEDVKLDFPCFKVENSNRQCHNPILQSVKSMGFFKKLQRISFFIESYFNKETNRIENRVVVRQHEWLIEYSPSFCVHQMHLNKIYDNLPSMTSYGVTSSGCPAVNFGRRKVMDHMCKVQREFIYDRSLPEGFFCNIQKVIYPNLKEVFFSLNPGKNCEYPFRILLVLYGQLWARSLLEKDSRFQTLDNQPDVKAIDHFIENLLKEIGIPHDEIYPQLAPQDEFLYHITTCRLVYGNYYRLACHRMAYYFGSVYSSMPWFGSKQMFRRYIQDLEEKAMACGYTFVSFLFSMLQ